MRKHRFLDEHDRDLYEADLMYTAWLERKRLAGYRAVDSLVDDGYDEDDPYDRLKSEGGHLSE